MVRSDNLKDTEALQITEIVIAQSDITADNVKIVTVK